MILASSEEEPIMTVDQIARFYLETVEADLKTYRASLNVPAVSEAATRGLRVGDLWMTTGSDQWPPFLVLITWSNNGECRGIPVFDEPELAGGDDIIVTREQSSLGTPLVCCAWRDILLSSNSLASLVGVVPDDVMEPIAMLLQHRLAGGFAIKVRSAEVLSTGTHALGWRIGSRSLKTRECTYIAGFPIVRANDPRLAIRRHLVACTNELEIRALAELNGEPRFRIDSAKSAPTFETPDLRVSGVIPLHRPRRIAFGGVPSARAAAAAGGIILVATAATGDRVTLQFDSEGAGEAINTISTFQFVAISVTTAGSTDQLSIGIRGKAAQPVLLLPRGQTAIWTDPVVLQSHPWTLDVFVESDTE